jgi:hypothetical protein
MSTESGSFGDVLITGTVVYGVAAALAAVLYVYMSMFDYEEKASDDVKTTNLKKRRFIQRMMSFFGALALGAMGLGYLFVLFKIGTVVRSDGVTVNWSYFAFAAVAWSLLGTLHGYFFNLDGYSRRMALGGLWAAAMVLLAVGPLSPHGVKRDVCYGVSVALQAVSIAYLFWFQGKPRALLRIYGWIPAAFVLLAFLLYDVFWFIGYLNLNSSAVELTSRWKAHLAFFFADLCAFVISAVAAFMLYKPERATGGFLPQVDVTLAASSQGLMLDAVASP